MADPTMTEPLEQLMATEEFDSSISHHFLIDIVGTCNLKCPSCPVGSFDKSLRPRGTMRAEVFSEIIAKIKQEMKGDLLISLYNWGEPSINPEFGQILRLCRENRLTVQVSSNLNFPRYFDYDAFFEYFPDRLIISTSGFIPRSYQYTHKGGDFSKFMKNFWRIADERRQVRHKNHVTVSYHVYKTNVKELGVAKHYCDEAGFVLSPVLAFFMPLEKIIYDSFTESDRDIIERMFLNPENVEELAGTVNKDRKFRDCRLRSNQTVINFDGSVALCCATYEEAPIAGNFLDPAVSFQEIMSAKYRHPLCGPCMKRNLHITNEVEVRNLAWKTLVKGS